jgi:AcrR family transcriptional regulator
MLYTVSPRESAKKAWVPSESDGSDNAVTNRILDAARRRFEAQGVAATTMSEIAADASISRAWLYRQFANREAVLRALIAREAQLLVAEVRRASQPALSLAERLTESFVHIVRYLRGSALVKRVLVSDEQHTAPYLLGDAVPILRWGIATLTTSLSEGPDGLSPAKAKRASETFVRLMFSIAISPSLVVDLDNPRELKALATHVVQGLLA